MKFTQQRLGNESENTAPECYVKRLNIIFSKFSGISSYSSQNMEPDWSYFECYIYRRGPEGFPSSSGVPARYAPIE
jgi:hypothetical protein